MNLEDEDRAQFQENQPNKAPAQPPQGSESQRSGIEKEVEEELKALDAKIAWAIKDLMNVFFRNDTWEFRRRYLYRTSTSGLESVGLTPAQLQIANETFKELSENGKIEYIDAAYRIPDELAAMRLSIENFFNKKYKDFETAVANIYTNLTKCEAEFNGFLESEYFRKAFVVTIDKVTDECQISDLELNADELKDKWKEWFGQTNNDN
jgi:hypothetical protein